MKVFLKTMQGGEAVPMDVEDHLTLAELKEKFAAVGLRHFNMVIEETVAPPLRPCPPTTAPPTALLLERACTVEQDTININKNHE